MIHVIPCNLWKGLSLVFWINKRIIALFLKEDVGYNGWTSINPLCVFFLIGIFLPCFRSFWFLINVCRIVPRGKRSQQIGIRAYISYSCFKNGHSKTGCGKVHGRDFQLWRLKIRALLVHQGIEEVLEDSQSSKKPRKIKYEDLQDAMDKAHNTLILSLGDGVLREVGDQTSAASL